MGNCESSMGNCESSMGNCESSSPPVSPNRLTDLSNDSPIFKESTPDKSNDLSQFVNTPYKIMNNLPPHVAGNQQTTLWLDQPSEQTSGHSSDQTPILSGHSSDQTPILSGHSSDQTPIKSSPDFKEFPEEYNVLRYLQSVMGKINHHTLIKKLRPLAYASEVGESFRPLVKPWIVTTMYGLSIGYCLVDTGIHTTNVWNILIARNKQSNTYHPRFMDLTPSADPSVLPTNGTERYVETYSSDSFDSKLSDNQIKFYTAINFADRAFWHTWASMILPAFTIHQIVKYSEIGLRSGLAQMKRFKLSDNLKFPRSNVNDFITTLTYETDKTKVLQLLKYSRVGSTIAGLCAIPFIIHPLDHGVDVVMDNMIRPMYSKYLVNINTSTDASSHKLH